MRKSASRGSSGGSTARTPSAPTPKRRWHTSRTNAATSPSTSARPTPLRASKTTKSLPAPLIFVKDSSTMTHLRGAISARSYRDPGPRATAARGAPSAAEDEDQPAPSLGGRQAEREGAGDRFRAGRAAFRVRVAVGVPVDERAQAVAA